MVDVVVHAVFFGELFNALAEVQRVKGLEERLLIHLSRDLLAEVHVVRIGQHGHRLEELVQVGAWIGGGRRARGRVVGWCCVVVWRLATLIVFQNHTMVKGGAYQNMIGWRVGKK